MIDVGAVEMEEVARAGEACQNHSPGDSVTYKAALQTNVVKSLADVVATFENDTGETVVDARPAGRWQGRAPEPRQGLPSGHVPGSKNIPWDAMLDTVELERDAGSYKRFKSEDDIRRVLSEAGLDANSTDFSDVIASCGSGTTACILVLASEQLQVRLGFPLCLAARSIARWRTTPHERSTLTGQDGVDERLRRLLERVRRVWIPDRPGLI